ncbi:hypothetical protein GWC77_27280 [Paraburkholderia sp. NMBU_R16]|nr:hypothetical protein [Paraburkholderia sp. NMBU_R16]
MADWLRQSKRAHHALEKSASGNGLTEPLTMHRKCVEKQAEWIYSSCPLRLHACRLFGPFHKTPHLSLRYLVSEASGDTQRLTFTVHDRRVLSVLLQVMSQERLGSRRTGALARHLETIASQPAARTFLTFSSFSTGGRFVGFYININQPTTNRTINVYKYQRVKHAR